ncbi:MAG: family 78 glycoside hydrolase catalytic domain [Bacteroidetes bacterium]|nr:family 78 glycoside hydrolase catalytic domain [Bacteroidota bacterium]
MFFTSLSFAQSLLVSQLSCGYRENPIGIDQLTPYLGWQLVSEEKNILQVAYRIIVADDSLLLKKNTPNIWDSKKVNSSASIQVKYLGTALKSATNYYWQVIVWDNKGHVATSKINYWKMGLLTSMDWQNARWIAYDNLSDSNKIIPALHGTGKKEWGKRQDVLPLFRKSFSINKKVQSASMFISGLGHFEAYINGTKIGNDFLDPGWTKYDKQALYLSFDVTANLKSQQNAIGIMLGNGFYYVPSERYRKLTGAFDYPKMICRLLIQYTDGTTENIVSNTSWKTSPSPITFSSIYGGEDYDARLEQAHWNEGAFIDNSWKSAVLTDGPILNTQNAEPLKIMESFNPISSKQLSSTKWVFDMSQNMSGIPAISVKGKAGDTIKISTAELLNADGTINQKGAGGPNFYQYILKGNGEESWQPRFTYYGFRYIQIENAVPLNESNTNSAPIILEVKGLHTRNSAKSVGSFSCSNELFNQTNKLIDWSIKSNMASVFTDCPHREKLGWLEETHLVGSSVKFEYDIATLCAKAITDMQVSQTPTGLIPEIAPEFVEFTDKFRDSPEWGSAAVLLPWYIYQWYGNQQVLADSYNMMQRYLDYLATKETANGILIQGLGDWYDLGPKSPGESQLTPAGLTATAIYYYDITVVEKIAKLFNKETDIIKYHQLAEKVKAAFNKQFFNPITKQYGSGSQTSNAMALYMKLVDTSNELAVVENLVKDIQNRNYALTAGDIGYRYVLKVLNEAGRSDVIFKMNNRNDVPGYGFQLAHGATALTESWAALPNVSNNHFMLGHIMEWFYEGIAGISQASDGVGFNKIIIRPQVVGDIKFAKASYQSINGLIISDWKKTDTDFLLNVTVPANTNCTVYLPIGPNSIIEEAGKTINGYTIASNMAIVSIGSGNYHFKVKN